MNFLQIVNFKVKKNNFLFLSLLFLFEVFLNSISILKADNKEFVINEINNYQKYNRNFNISISYKEFKNILKQDAEKYELKIVNDYLDPKNEKFDVDIESDIQYRSGDIFYAEGNAIVYFTNSQLIADKILYNTVSKEFQAFGNVSFKKGSQSFKAAKIKYNLKTQSGFLEDVYGVINVEKFDKDFDFLNSSSYKKDSFIIEKAEINNLKYINSAEVGLNNLSSFRDKKSFNDLYNNFKFDIPRIKKWRFKSEKIFINNNNFNSKLIFFTNDVFNEPQLILESKDFNGEMIDNKMKLISRSTWLVFENKFKFPIGRRTIYDKEARSQWGIGSDFEEKDGFYFVKKYDPINISKKYALQFTPYILFQRGIKGKTNSYPDKNKSILSNKVVDDIYLPDLFALDSLLVGELLGWDLNLLSSTSSLNPERFDRSSRAKLSLSKSIPLNNEKNKEDLFSRSIDINNLNYKEDLLSKIFYQNKLNDKEKIFSGSFYFDDFNHNEFSYDKQILKNYFIDGKKIANFNSYIDLRISSVFREQVERGFSGDSEIYFANNFIITSRNSFTVNQSPIDFKVIYNVGKFTAEDRSKKELITLVRNVFASKLTNEIWLWNRPIDSFINNDYKYSPLVIRQGIRWVTNIDSGIFLYSDGSDQNGISLSFGPEIIIGSMKSKFLDYTNVKLEAYLAHKSGDSPFAFDRINETTRLKVNVAQQVIGPLVFNYESYLNLENGDFSAPKYVIDIKRRAYSFGTFYDSGAKSVGFKLDIHNFDYQGSAPSF